MLRGLDPVTMGLKPPSALLSDYQPRNSSFPISDSQDKIPIESCKRRLKCSNANSESTRYTQNGQPSHLSSDDTTGSGVSNNHDICLLTHVRAGDLYTSAAY